MEVVTPDTQATLLLTSRLGASDVKPLTLAEYNQLARQLQERNLRPSDLLRGAVENFLISSDRLRGLVSRGAALAMAVERWMQAGIRVVGRSEASYPTSLKGKLRTAAAPVLYFSGNLDLGAREGICVVGSREATASGIAFAADLGRKCAAEGFNVISGDARGVDREAMQAALGDQGTVLGILADSLNAAVLSRRNRDAILSGRLLLLSPFDPESRFTVAHAMERNRYLYAMATVAVVVDSDLKGGTWSGAVENLKHGWTPAFVRTGRDAGRGNARLAELGLMAVPDGSITSVRGLVDRTLNGERASSNGKAELPLFGNGKGSTVERRDLGKASAFLDFFLNQLKEFLTSSGETEEGIAVHFGLERSQVRCWLEYAESKRLVTRLKGSHRFVWSSPEQGTNTHN